MASNTHGKTTGSITAQNTGIDAGQIQYNFNVSLSGTWVATVKLQRSYDGTNYVDVKSYTANIEELGYEPEAGMIYRFFVETGGFTSGTVVFRISQ